MTSRDAEGEITPQERIGQTVGKYEIVRVIGKGGMGCVYEAVNRAIGKHVAMKCIDPELASNEEANARFQREAMAAGAVESPHIVQIFDAGDMEDGTPFIVMELLRGQDLGMLLSERGQLEVDETLRLVAQILKALSHAHDAGIVHRDLKPDNVFLAERDDEPPFVKLLDFGVSKVARTGKDVPLQTLTRQGTVVGTPYYMSPEQAQAFTDVDGRTDIYSVGAILYECLAGRPPHAGNSYEQVIVHICMHDAEDVRTHNAAIPDAVAEVTHKALSREREDRYGTAREMLEAVVDAAPPSLGLARPSGAPFTIPAGAVTTRPEGTRSGPISYPTEQQVVASPSAKVPSALAQTVEMEPDEDEDDPRDGRQATTPAERAGAPSVTESGISPKVDPDTVPTLRAEEAEPLAVPGAPRRRPWLRVLVAAGATAAALGAYVRYTGGPSSGGASAAPDAVRAETEAPSERGKEAERPASEEGASDGDFNEGAGHDPTDARSNEPAGAGPRASSAPSRTLQGRGATERVARPPVAPPTADPEPQPTRKSEPTSSSKSSTADEATPEPPEPEPAPEPEPTLKLQED